MTAGPSDRQPGNEVTGGPSRRHFVHVYTVIRVKVAVDAADHRSAMRAADDLLFADKLAVDLFPTSSAVLDAEYAEEVAGYLVVEAGDDMFSRSRSYGPDYEPDGHRREGDRP